MQMYVLIKHVVQHKTFFFKNNFQKGKYASDRSGDRQTTTGKKTANQQTIVRTA